MASLEQLSAIMNWLQSYLMMPVFKRITRWPLNSKLTNVAMCRRAVQGLVSLCESKSAGCNSKARTFDLRHLRQIIARRDKGLLDPIARSLSGGFGPNLIWFRVQGLGLRIWV